jgi:hypothetical protein
MCKPRKIYRLRLDSSYGRFQGSSHGTFPEATFDINIPESVTGQLIVESFAIWNATTPGSQQVNDKIFRPGGMINICSNSIVDPDSYSTYEKSKSDVLFTLMLNKVIYYDLEKAVYSHQINQNDVGVRVQDFNMQHRAIHIKLKDEWYDGLTENFSNMKYLLVLVIISDEEEEE